MSKNNKVSIVCPKCKNTFSILQWDSVNFDEDPQLKELILNGEFWNYRCPICSLEIEVRSALLINSPSKKYMVQYESNSLTPENIRKRTVDLTNEWKQSSETMFNGLKKMKYKLRYVNKIQDLIEKIKIFEDELNDIVIEEIKYCMIPEITKNLGYIKPIYYSGIVNDQILILNFSEDVFSNDIVFKLPVGNMYNIADKLIDEVIARIGIFAVEYVDYVYSNNIHNLIKRKEVQDDDTVINKMKYCKQCKKEVKPNFHNLCPYCDNEI